jgi:hypothetical protein
MSTYKNLADGLMRSLDLALPPQTHCPRSEGLVPLVLRNRIG